MCPRTTEITKIAPRSYRWRVTEALAPRRDRAVRPAPPLVLCLPAQL